MTWDNFSNFFFYFKFFIFNFFFFCIDLFNEIGNHMPAQYWSLLYLAGFSTLTELILYFTVPVSNNEESITYNYEWDSEAIINEIHRSKPKPTIVASQKVVTI